MPWLTTNVVNGLEAVQGCRAALVIEALDRDSHSISFVVGVVPATTGRLKVTTKEPFILRI